MIKFFRKIRQKLLDENRFKRYVIYALGEIFLVMVGILIALQINNWNEHRKERIIEKKILEEVLLDMYINKYDVENMIKTSEKRLKKVSEINDHLIYKKPQYDSLGIQLREASSTAQFKPRLIGYTSLNSKGFDIIQNENLRNYIIRTYGLSFQDLIMEGREFEQFDNPTKDLLPYIKKHLVVDTSMVSEILDERIDYSFETYGLTVKDYDALLNDSEFILILQKSMFNRAKKIIIAKRLVNTIAEVEDMIKAELETM